ncbi:hypothetical protein [Bacillus sp. AFS041924]|uniref:hypothetical protein n=1 Tax=Bacillus sp. AFS041924 TaxID=2033503 RepID=UPI000BFE7A21|nr:hypothetical protein [Bacillus sp. AFS041924]PGS54228.1 hypothetical protein COC46_05845 [Bacillus sp. AFS041924]
MSNIIFTTNFSKLEQNFNDIILEIVNDGSTRFRNKYNIKFINRDYRMTVDELLNKDQSIAEYHYDFYGKDHNGKDHKIFGFHCQSH